MNIKKSFLVAFAGATAFATLSAFAVSAATPGYSDGAVDEQVETSVSVVAGQDTAVKADFTKSEAVKSVEAVIPADATTATGLNFVAAVVQDPNAVAALADAVNFDAAQVLDLYFADQDGNKVDFNGKNVAVTITAPGFNTIYVYEDGKLEEVASTVEGDKISFTAPHFSTYVLANVAKSVESSDNSTTSTPSNNNGTTQTGDAGFATTIVIFSIMAVVSLGTAIVATKAKKSSK